MHITTTELVTFQKADLIQIAPDRLARLTNAGAKWNARISANNAPFSMQHQDRVLEELKTSNNIAQIVKINQNESPLYWLYQRKHKSGQPLLSER